MRKQTKPVSALPDSTSLASCPRWQLQDAKAQFSEVVQQALEGSPQCVTKHGDDAVVVISYETLVQLVRPTQNLYEFFRHSPLVDAGLDLTRLPSGLREVDL